MKQFVATNREVIISQETKEGKEMILALATVRNYLDKGNVDKNILSCMVSAANNAIQKTNKAHNSNFPPMELEFNVVVEKNQP